MKGHTQGPSSRSTVARTSYFLSNLEKSKQNRPTFSRLPHITISVFVNYIRFGVMQKKEDDDCHPLGGDSRSRTDDPLLAKQVL